MEGSRGLEVVDLQVPISLSSLFYGLEFENDRKFGINVL